MKKTGLAGMDDYRMLTTVECVTLTGLSRKTLWRCIREGNLKATRIRPNMRRVRVGDLKRFLEGGAA